MFKKFFVFGLIISFLFTSCQGSKEGKFDKEKYRAELGGHAKDFMSGLKSVLIENMKEGGALQAVNVCSDTAADLAVKYSEAENVVVKRVSNKNRNDNNFPDVYEQKALSDFEKLLAEGRLNSETSKIEKVIINGKYVVKYFKPIIVSAPCLNCHGTESQISEKVAQVLKQKYPNDKATGYKIGDMRGAVSVSKVL